MTTKELLSRAVLAKAAMARADSATKNRALRLAADYLIRDMNKILEANSVDMECAKDAVSSVMLQRLFLSDAAIVSMADSLRSVAQLPDPVGELIEQTTRPNGLQISKVRVPIGVIAIIYESRPNVTSDAAALSLKSGNVCVLRGGKEAIQTNIAIANAFRDALHDSGLPMDAVNLVSDTSRNSATELMEAVGSVDLLIPRGGAGLIRACVEQAKVPCIQTGTGICHIYVDKDANFDDALNIIDNAKTSRPSVCNAAEVCLVHASIAERFLPMLKQRLTQNRTNPVELRLDKSAAQFVDGTPANANDFDTEFLDYILAVKIVSDVTEAIEHIAEHSTGHSESIVTTNSATADLFLSSVDSAAVYVNASTRFTDGGEFGLGCEIGISTQKLHARGPMGLKEMTTYQYRVRGNGQIR